MPDTIDALFAFIFAGAAVWTLVPATESLARSIGDRAIDYPNERSLHEFPTPKARSSCPGTTRPARSWQARS
jgi:hypothetical protein